MQTSDNYKCKIATLDEIIKKYDYEIAQATKNKDNWATWKEKTIEQAKKGLVITYIGVLNNEIISECYAALDPSIVQNHENLVDDKTAYLYAFRTNKKYQGQGYFSRLFKFALNDLRTRGYKKVTLGVEPNEEKNKAIYTKYGFKEYIKTAKMKYPNGDTIDVEYYGKPLD
ncbi:N-acetyltransferase [Candidatus Saccharibacteria bacterium]|nr:N-acetyltransferase [Candidatus Saccharibacteria bacterium]